MNLKIKIDESKQIKTVFGIIIPNLQFTLSKTLDKYENKLEKSNEELS